MAPASLLLAAFGPHRGAADDPASAIVRALAPDWDSEGRDLVLHAMVVPWSHTRAPALLRERLHALRPDLLVLLDQDPTSPDHVLQVFGANWIDDAAPDEDGAVVRETIIDEAGPVAYRSRLPLDGVWDKFLVERVPVRMGHKAGWSVFNHAYYAAMRCIHTEGLETLGGAVHLPALPGQTEGVEGRALSQQVEDIDMLLMTVRHLFAKVQRDEEAERLRRST